MYEVLIARAKYSLFQTGPEVLGTEWQWHTIYKEQSHIEPISREVSELEFADGRKCHEQRRRDALAKL